MKSKALIKNIKLPDAPPPTRANFHDHPVVGDGKFIKVLPTDYKPTPAIKPHPKAKGQGKGNRVKGLTPQRAASLEKARIAQQYRASQREEKIIALYEKGLSNNEIAAEMGSPVKSIASKLCRLRRDGVIQERETPDYEKDVIRLYNEGVFIHNIAEEVGLKECQVNTILTRLRKHGKVGNRTDRHWKPTQDSDLIRLWNKGYTMKEIAKRMNVSDSVIFNHTAKLQKAGKIERRNK